MNTVSIYITPKDEYKKIFNQKYDMLYWHLSNKDEVVLSGSMEGSLIKVVIQANALNKWLTEMEKLIADQFRVVTPYQAVEVSSTDAMAEKEIAKRRRVEQDILELSEDEIDALLGRKQPSHAPEPAQSEEKDQTLSKEELVVRYSPEMMKYIEEVTHVSRALAEVDSFSQFFETALLISVDDGQGYSEFLEVLAARLNEHRGKPMYGSKVAHLLFSNDRGIRDWESECNALKHVKREIGTNGDFVIRSYDMRTWMRELTDPNYLRKIGEFGDIAENILLVFRIPHMDKQKREELEKMLSSVISIRSLSIPSITLESMVAYLKYQFEIADFKVEDNCEDVLEEWICQEQNEGMFCGYNSLDKMMDELIYQKALLSRGNSTSQTTLKTITRNDIKNMLTNDLSEEKDAYELLDAMIGLDDVKLKIRELVSQIKMQKQMREQGVDIGSPTLHMLFLGNPGTGKTTVARILGKIFRQEGLLKKGHFFEKTGSDFVDGKVGTLAKRIEGYCRESYGSVLFVDEAYAMSVGHSTGNITDETVPVLVTEMENHRDELCVIFAGYQDEMDAFLKSNSGLRSRVPNVLDFPNYSREELVEIFFYMLQGKFEYEEGLRECVAEYMISISDTALNAKEFSNARFVRNLYERVWGKVAYRINFQDDKEMMIKKKDFNDVVAEEDFQAMVSQRGRKQIGFKVD